MKVILIDGDNDYAAWNFEGSGINKKDAWFNAHESNGQWDHVSDGEVDFRVTSYEFEDVDSKFIDFINGQVVNYESSKHTNFYVV